MNYMPIRHAKHAAPQRARGQLALRFACDQTDGITRVVRFFQEGCLKARLPRSQVATMAEVVTLNISGGVAGGDQLSTEIVLEPHAQLCVASQSAEKIYRALGDVPSEIATSVRVGGGALLEYLPQETIVFDGFALRRHLSVDLAADAVFVGIESLIFGRQAHGERVVTGRLNDVVSLRREGALLLQDHTRLDGEIEAMLGRKAVADGNIAMANIIYAGNDAAPRLLKVREALGEGSGLAGASAFHGVLRVRLLAPDAASLRRVVVAVLRQCRDGRPLPRVWQG